MSAALETSIDKVDIQQHFSQDQNFGSANLGLQIQKSLPNKTQRRGSTGGVSVNSECVSPKDVGMIKMRKAL